MKKLLISLIIVAAASQSVLANKHQMAADQLKSEIAQAHAEINRLVSEISKKETKRAHEEAEAARYELMNNKQPRPAAKKQIIKKYMTNNRN